MNSLTKNQNILNTFIFTSAIILIITRDINFFLTPTLWAEEATKYFYDAYNNGAIALFHEHQGYYSIIANVAGYFATLVPLEYAPVITKFFAFIIQSIPFYLIYINKSIFINTPLRKILFSTAVLIVGCTVEIWLTVISSQFYFVIIVFLILLDQKQDMQKSKKYLFFILAFISGLSGVPANILAPLFIYNFFITKEKENLSLFAIFVITISIQLTFILTAERVTQIPVEIPYDVIGNIFISLFQYPIFQSWDTGMKTVILFPLIYILIKYVSQKNYFETFFVSAFLLTFIMIITSLGMRGGERYTYAPSVIMIFGLIISTLDTSLPKAIRIILGFYLFLAFVSGIQRFPFNFTKGTPQITWYEQAILYKAHKLDTIQIYPRPWKITLPRKEK